jgi:hypothetical protein
MQPHLDIPVAQLQLPQITPLHNLEQPR